MTVATRGVEDALSRATARLGELRHPLVDPLFPAAILRGAARVGVPLSCDPVLRAWLATRGRLQGPGRYAWGIDPIYAGPLPAWVPPRASWQPWRSRDREALAADPGLRKPFSERLLTPIIVADNVELLHVAARDEPEGPAQQLLDDAMPTLRRDAAGWAQEIHSSGDTWALWAVARRPGALLHLQPFVLGGADAYATTARRTGGVVLGTRFPFHEQPLVSASAALATTLLALGIHPQLSGALAAWVRTQEQPDGGFGDAGDASDPVTTFLAADLLATIDPAYDPARAAAFLATRQRPDGWWTAFGPETTWLTVELVDWIRTSSRPFAERFRWPHLAVTNRDRRTGLAWYSYYAELERLFSAVPSLGAATVEVAFVDLAGFGEVNNALGMAVGDAILRALAQELGRIERSVAIRDGGDEFLVLGAPTATGLPQRLEQFRTRWAARVAAEFGDDVVVAPRVLTASTRGDALVRAREVLGREIGALKHTTRELGGLGVQVDRSTSLWKELST